MILKNVSFGLLTITYLIIRTVILIKVVSVYWNYVIFGFRLFILVSTVKDCVTSEELSFLNDSDSVQKFKSQVEYLRDAVKGYDLRIM